MTATEGTALLEHAEALLDARSLQHAIARFDEAERLGASSDRCSAGRWMVWMLLGEFERAWRESDAIRRRGAYDPHRFWNGEELQGKRLIVRCLHGFGDAVQMLRFAPLLREQCASLVVEVPPQLFDLASCFEGVDDVITWGALAPATAPRCDVQIEVMELPYVLRVRASQLPGTTAYLELPSARKRSVAQTMKPKGFPRVGIVWAAGEWNLARSLPLDFVKQLVSIPGCEVWNLQGGVEQSRWPMLCKGHPAARDAAECGDGIMTLAAVIERLDLVITVDTLAAHLAGALGTPAWVLLQHAADWRWMIDRPDSPWYPSLKLHRQAEQGNWAGAINRVAHDLTQWLQTETHLERAC